MKCPESNEFAPYFQGYVSLVPETDILSAMSDQIAELRAFAATISAEKETFAYAPGKWTIREVFGHFVDGERFFAQRSFSISRGDKNPLFGFDENAYIENSPYNNEPLQDLLEEFCALRTANILMYKHFTTEMWDARGMSSEVSTTARAFAYISVGHVRHHLKILKERYFNH